jgi:hypothetical protein
MMKLLLTLVFTSVVFLLNGQCPSIRFSYDNVGNRISRRYTACIQEDDVLKKESPLGQQTNSVEMAIYPNPNDGHFNITLSAPVEDAWLEFYDMAGRKLHTQSVGNQTIDVSVFAVGSYWVVYRNAQTIFAKSKMMIQH